LQTTFIWFSGLPVTSVRNQGDVNLRKIIAKRFERTRDGINVAGDVNAVVSANVDEPSSTNAASRRTRTRIVQRSGRTAVSETEVDGERGERG
jgi:hypothetical protein